MMPDPSLDVNIWDQCRGSLLSFSRAVKPKYQYPWHIQKLMDILEKVERGELTRVMISFPPRHGKSETASVLFPAWFAGRNPDKEIMLVSGTQKLATKFGARCRNVITSPQFNTVFPETLLDPASHAKGDFAFTAGGSAFYAGLKGQITGRGAHLFILDDLITGSQEAKSEVSKDYIRNWYYEECYNRLMSDDVAPHGRIILIGTRWREDDVQGWLLDPDEQDEIDDWTIFNFPAIAEEDEEFRQKGDALWPSKYSQKTLETIRAKNESTFRHVYQQQPSVETGMIVQKSWLNVEKIDPKMLKGARILALDTAFKEKMENDFSAATIGQRYGDRHLAVLYAEQVKMDFPKLIQWVLDLIRKWDIQGIVVEDAASGQSLIQTLRKLTKIPIIALKIQKGQDKESRLHAITPFMESGGVLFDKWLPLSTQMDLFKNLLQFPNGAHDDMTDSFVHLITYLLRGGLSLRKLGGRSRTVEIPSIYGK